MAMAPAYGARGLLLLGLALAAHGEDDALALVQRGLRVRGPEDAAGSMLPAWVSDIINSQGVEDEAAEEEEISEEEQAQLDKDAEIGEDFYINYTKMEEQSSLEENANITAPTMKWLFLSTSYDSVREFTNDHIQGEWRYAGSPGKFSINSNPQGELIYHTPLNEEHDQIAILLPISEGGWLLEGVVQDPNRTGLSRVRVKGMEDPNTLVVSFAGLNGANWSVDVPASRADLFEKLMPIKNPAPKVVRKKAQAEKMQPDLTDLVDKECWGPMMITPECIKKHGVPKHHGHGKEQGVKAQVFNVMKKLAGLSGDGGGSGPDTGEEMSSQLDLDNNEADSHNGLAKGTAGHMNPLKIMEQVLGGASGALGGINATEVLVNLLGSLPAGTDVNGALQGLLGGDSPAAGMLQGLLGGSGNGPGIAQTFMNLFNDSDQRAGELPIEAFHRKFKALRLAVGGSSSSASKNQLTGKSASSESSTDPLAQLYNTEEFQNKSLYGGCKKKGLRLANYTLANHTPQGVQMWWPFELNDKGLDYGWLLDNWKSIAGVDVGSPLPEDGVVTGWEWYGSGTHENVAIHDSINEPAHFQVLRWVPSMTGKKFRLIGQSTANSTILRVKNHMQLDPADYIHVKKGDFIGFYFPGQAITGYTMAPICSIQLLFTAPPLKGISTVGETADYLLGGEKGSPRAYHVHAQYLSKSAGADSEPVTTLWRD